MLEKLSSLFSKAFSSPSSCKFEFLSSLSVLLSPGKNVERYHVCCCSEMSALVLGGNSGC